MAEEELDLPSDCPFDSDYEPGLDCSLREESPVSKRKSRPNGKDSRKKRKLSPLPPENDVPCPRVKVFSPVERSRPGRTGSLLLDKELLGSRNGWAHVNQAPIFKVDATREQFHSRPKNTTAQKEIAQAKIDALARQLAQTQSAIVIDRNGDPLVGYYSYRLKTATVDKTLSAKSTLQERRQAFLARAKPLEDQYIGRTTQPTPDDPLFTYDGMPPDLVRRTLEASQMIAFAHRPEVNPRDIRHLPNNDGSDYRLTTYPSPHHPPGPFPNDTSRYLNIVQGRQGRLDKKKKDPTDREQSVHIQSPITLPERHGLENQHVRVFGEKGERCGVLHFANGWPQQATGMGDILHPSSHLAADGYRASCNKVYFRLTQEVAAYLGQLFKALFPEFHSTYQKAFEAGVWLPEDNGPWLARAVVYKLQVHVHRDGLDGGPTATFPVGYFSGGNMVYPDINAKYLYEPGAVCISLSASLYHAVEKWHPIPCPPELQVDNITPGRIGTVFFFPEKSLQTLEGKPPGWMRETAGGLLPLSAPSPSKSQDYDRKKIEARKKYDLIGAQKKAKNAARNRQAATNGT